MLVRSAVGGAETGGGGEGAVASPELTTTTTTTTKSAAGVATTNPEIINVGTAFNWREAKATGTFAPISQIYTLDSAIHLLNTLRVLAQSVSPPPVVCKIEDEVCTVMQNTNTALLHY